MSDKRLIEAEFPLKETSLDSVHEKNVRHGHLSTLHIWPARRPLAACRAVVLSTLLPCPEDEEERHALVKRIGGQIRTTAQRGRAAKEETEGSLTRWLGTPPKLGRSAIEAHRALTQRRENELEFFRGKIREAYGGRAPRVLDPFSGGGAIPLEAMRLGCETYAMDINPVACFVLGATLKYPQALAGKTFPLPEFALRDAEFMKALSETHPEFSERQQNSLLPGMMRAAKGVDLAWQVRAWGRRVLSEARKTLGAFYPTYAEFEPWCKDGAYPYEKVPMKLVPLTRGGKLDMKALNGDFSAAYLADQANARWVEKPTVAYLWARTCRCSSCRAEIPMLKTKWLCKKDNKRVLLTVTPNDDKTGVVFDVQENVPVVGDTNRQRTAHDSEIGKGFMSRRGVTCPCCGATMTKDDIKIEGRAGRIGLMPTAVIYEQTNAEGKRYRLPTSYELECARRAEEELPAVFADIPFGIPEEIIVEDAKRNTWCVQYGIDKFYKLFLPRQLFTLGVFCKEVRKAMVECQDMGYPEEWAEAIGAYLTIGVDRLADRQSTICRFDKGRESLQGTFTRFALPITWDFAEGSPLSDATGNFCGGIEWITKYIDHALNAAKGTVNIINQSCVQPLPQNLDCIITDPPYYDAIGYAVLMDFFYIWLRRTTSGTILDNGIFSNPLAPKWDNERNDGELIDDASRHGGDRAASKKAYEDGMAEVFKRCHEALMPEGRLVIVFANKQADAWETMVSAIVKAGFMVTASWPIATEMINRTRGIGSAALSTSVWLVCKKREPARSGWDSKVIEDMRANITGQLREFWDAGVRGPDFVWAATGPALSAYSSYPIVKKADASGLLTVSEFLGEVRRIVVEFVVGRVLQGEGNQAAETAGLDNVTAYYLLHRNDFGLEEAPAGACILYATACGLSDGELASAWNIIRMGSGSSDSDSDDDDEGSGDSGGKIRLMKWKERRHANLGLEGRNGRPVPLIDRIHKLMHLWEAGEQRKVDDFLDAFALRRNELFLRVIQSLIELSDADERAILESISNHVHSRGAQTTSHVQDRLQ